MPMTRLSIALALVISTAVFADPPADAVNRGEELKAAAISKIEADIEAATERKAEAGKADNRPLVKQLFADIKHLKTQLIKAKAKTPEQYVADEDEKARIAKAKQEQEDGQQKWYEGGTLHKKTVAEWSKAAKRDKVATSADFVTHAWKAGVLKDFIANGIKNMDDIRPLAERLAAEIDIFYAQGQLAGGSDVALAAAKVMDRRWTKPL